VHLVGSNTDDSSILLSVFRVRESKPKAKKKLHSRHITIRHSRYSNISNIRELIKIYSHMRMDSGFEIHLAVTSARKRKDTERNLSSPFIPCERNRYVLRFCIHAGTHESTCHYDVTTYIMFCWIVSNLRVACRLYNDIQADGAAAVECSDNREVSRFARGKFQ